MKKPAKHPGRWKTYGTVLFVMVLVASLAVIGCGTAPLEAYPKGGSSGQVDLLIITHPSLLGEVDTLAGIKQEAGLKTVVVTTAGIEAHFKGRDLPEKMRNCAVEYQKNRGAYFLLIVGDSKLVPTRYVFTPNLVEGGLDKQDPGIAEASKSRDPAKHERYFVPSDLYFANHSDDWDINRNGLYGEVAALTGLDRDEGGFSANMAAGRIPARSSADLAPVVEKISRYSMPEQLAALFISATKDAGPEFDGDAFSQHVISQLGPSWTSEVVSEGQPGCTPEGLLEMLNGERYSLVAGVTHGFPFGLVVDSIKRWQVMQNHRVDISAAKDLLATSSEIENEDWFARDLEPTLLYSKDLARLSNPEPFFFMGFGCYISAFGYEPHYPVAEQLVMQENGAIASCGLASDVSEVMRAQFEAALAGTGGLQFELGDFIIVNVCKNGMTFGQALENARLEYASRNRALMSISDQRRALFGMALTGDPTLGLVKPTPHPLEI